MHLTQRSRRFLGGNSIVGSNIGIAAGMAAAARIRGERKAVVAFVGDGARGAGVVLETLRIAAKQALPLLLVCDNNGWQDRTASHIVTDHTPSAVAAGLGVPSTVVDGNDVGEVADIAGALLDQVRAGRGARFLEASTYLRDFHCQFGILPRAQGSFRGGDGVARMPLPHLIRGAVRGGRQRWPPPRRKRLPSRRPRPRRPGTISRSAGGDWR